MNNITAASLACLLALLLLGCEEGVDPFVGEERPFTLWGFMDAGADTQRVRVFSIEERLGQDRAGPIDAVVTSTDLTTGEHRLWRDAEIVFDDGSTGHVFWSAFRAAPEHRYRLEVTRSDGAVSSVEVTVPPPVDLQLDETSPSTLLPALITGEVYQILDIEVEYDVTTVPPSHPWPPGTPSPPVILYPVTISYAGEQERVENGWQVKIDMHRDFALIQDVFEANCLTRNYISLRRMTFRFMAANAEWHPPGGSFDPEVLIEPGAFSNVENGFGFFGGGYAVARRWRPRTAVLESIGYIFTARCLLIPLNVPECQLPPEPCFKEQ